jgi:hypothetical protein
MTPLDDATLQLLSIRPCRKFVSRDAALAQEGSVDRSGPRVASQQLSEFAQAGLPSPALAIDVTQALQ